MELPHPADSQSFGTPSSGPFRTLVFEAFRYWEFRRLFYNFALFAVVGVWLTATWPRFRPAMTLSSLMIMLVLGLIANVCYCAVYLVDIPLQLSSVREMWRNRRWVLWVVGTLLAIVLANYWIADEIYPFLQ